MTTYINFFPGSTRKEKKFFFSDDPAYGIEDITGFADSVLQGCTSSAPVEGAKAALEDGSIWGDLCAAHGDDLVQGVLEELHDVIK